MIKENNVRKLSLMIYLIAVICPPFAALIAGKRKQALINLLLTVLFYVPGLVHAMAVIRKSHDAYDTMHSWSSER
jgi:uncharacterized membrane protein YqaE (UPF0057 family)